MSKLSLEARSLLQEAKAQEQPASLATLQRVRRGVRAAVVGVTLGHEAAASTANTTSANSAASAATGTSLAAKLVSFALVGFGLGATGFGVATWVEKHESTPAPSAAVFAKQANLSTNASKRDEPPARASALPSPTTASLSPVIQERTALVSNQGSLPEKSRSMSRSEAEPTLQQELRLLAQVQAELRQGHGESALALLDRNRGPLGGSQQLAEERLAAEVFAACATGNVTRGKRAAEQFLRRAPSSPLAPRVRASCGGRAR